MPIRSTRTQLIFHHRFQLREFDSPLPARTYDIDTDEEVIEGNERTIYTRTATLIHVHGLGTSRIVTIDPTGLLEAAELDAAQGS